MIFEAGKFYSHEGGRQVAIISEIVSFKWGEMLLIEEADKTGHAMSCVEKSELNNKDIENNGWVEIGKEEWLQNFKEPICERCGKFFYSGEKYVLSQKGPQHFDCFADEAKEEAGSSVIH